MGTYEIDNCELIRNWRELQRTRRGRAAGRREVFGWCVGIVLGSVALVGAAILVFTF